MRKYEKLTQHNTHLHVASLKHENLSYYQKEDTEIERCVLCHAELAIMERNRSECWDCQDNISLTYSDDHIEVEVEVK